MAHRGEASIEGYLPIAEYAFLSDCHSTALVSRHGSVDWACFRRFDSPTAFCRLLDHERGGHFSICAADARVERRYLDGTLVLESTVHAPSGTARLVEAMVMRQGGAREPRHELVRVLTGVTGTVAFDVCLRPRFDYGLTAPLVRQAHAGAYVAVGGAEAMVVRTDADLDVDEEDSAFAGRCEIGAGETKRFLLTSRAAHEVAEVRSEVADADDRLAETIEWWRRWSDNGTAPGPNESRCASVRVLKGLTCAPTGAVIAAATTSLPEQIGANRNWDYRYSWVRDSSLVLDALVGTGHAEIARGFRDFLMRSAAGNAADLQIMYGAYGERHLPEVELDLDGYRGSRPVRVGNAAARQVQLDVYGHLLDAVDTWHDGTSTFDPALRRFLRCAVDIAAERWRQPDQGIWEMRGEPRHFVHSKVMCWVALDRGIGLAALLGAGDSAVDAWRAAADELRAEVMSHGIDPVRGCFRQHYATTDVDASLLKLPLVGFVDADHPAMLATVAAIQQDLGVGESGFIRRYAGHVDDGVDDDHHNDEGVFMLATCWLIEVLSLQGRDGEARALFERVLSYANDLGLYAEEVDVRTGELLGNFPQAFTHLGVLVAARCLDGCAAATTCSA
ncbi:MAG: glycoside hydrolase family 15 protein [Ilumatobacteraceae bacterium]